MPTPRSFEGYALRVSKGVLSLVFGALAELSGLRWLWILAGISILQIWKDLDYPTVRKWWGEMIFKMVLIGYLLALPLIIPATYARTGLSARILWATGLGLFLAEALLLWSGRRRRIWAFARTEG